MHWPGCVPTIRVRYDTMAHAILVHHVGGPEQLKFEAVAEKMPGPGEVRVVHRAIGVNFIDTYHRTGLYSLPRYPTGIGLEAAGIVESLGPGVTEFNVGDRVGYAGGSPGAYSTMRNIPARFLLKLPDSITDEAAAAMLLKGMTVEFLIRRAYEVRPGQTVLWHAAAGGVGLIACQWLSHLGARVIGTVGSKEKAALAQRHGCAETILYRQEDFAQRVLDLTQGQKLPVVYDSVGKDTFLRSLDCLQPRGLYVGFGNASGKPDPFDIAQLATKGSLYITRPTLFTYTANREELVASAAALFDVVHRGAVKVEISRQFALANAAAAHAHLEARGSTGSLLLMPDTQLPGDAVQ
jgi:NADPH:quinone reductase